MGGDGAGQLVGVEPQPAQLEFSAGEVVADNQYALSVTTGLSMRPVRHLGLLGLDATAIDSEDVITDGLYNINVGTAGHFSVAEGSTAALQPLLSSSSNAETLPAIQMQMLTDPEALLDDFAPSGESYILAARLTGPLNSAFPDGPPTEALPDAEGDLAEGADGAGDDLPEGTDGAHLASTESANVILVGDVDILSDRLWVQQQNFLGQTLATAFANNGDFLINALDNLSGSADLIGIRPGEPIRVRSRGYRRCADRPTRSFARPSSACRRN